MDEDLPRRMLNCLSSTAISSGDFLRVLPRRAVISTRCRMSVRRRWCRCETRNRRRRIRAGDMTDKQFDRSTFFTRSSNRFDGVFMLDELQIVRVALDEANAKDRFRSSCDLLLRIERIKVDRRPSIGRLQRRCHLE